MRVVIGGKLAAAMISAISLFLALLLFRYWVSETAVLELRWEGLGRVGHTEWRGKSAGGKGKRRRHGGPEMMWAWCFQRAKRRQGTVAIKGADCSSGETTGNPVPEAWVPSLVWPKRTEWSLLYWGILLCFRAYLPLCQNLESWCWEIFLRVCVFHL